MENNANFTHDLNVSYLSLLAKYDKKEEFAKLYGSSEPVLLDAVDRTTDVNMLNKLRAIIDYKRGLGVEKGMNK